MTPRRLRALSASLSAMFAVAFTVHVAALVWPSITEPSPVWRHLLFVCINGFFGGAFVMGAVRGRLPRWFLWLAWALVVQQSISHGIDLVRVFGEGRLDIRSLAVLLVMPLLALTATRLTRAPGSSE